MLIEESSKIRPFQIYHSMHSALVQEAKEFENASYIFNPKNDLELESISKRFHIYARFLKIHEKAEEDHLFPAVEKIFPHLSESFKFDHEQLEENIYSSIERYLTKLQDKPDREVHRHLRWNSVALRAMMYLHTTKENEILIPLIEANSSSDEQEKLMSDLLLYIPKDISPEIIPWVFVRLGLTEKASYLRALRVALPEREFIEMKNRMTEAVGYRVWDSIVRKVPEIA